MAKRNHAVVSINASGFNDETGTGGGNLATGIVIENRKVINSNHEVSEPALVAGVNQIWTIDNRKLYNKRINKYASNFCSWFYATVNC